MHYYLRDSKGVDGGEILENTRLHKCKTQNIHPMSWHISLCPSILQVVACLFLAVLALTQLSILMTRNPSFWWRFGSKTAPPPSLWLVIPVLTFCAASTIIAVYWPRSLQPDGGRGSLEGAGATYTLEVSL